MSDLVYKQKNVEYRAGDRAVLLQGDIFGAITAGGTFVRGVVAFGEDMVPKLIPDRMGAPAITLGPKSDVALLSRKDS